MGDPTPATPPRTSLATPSWSAWATIWCWSTSVALQGLARTQSSPCPATSPPMMFWTVWRACKLLLKQVSVCINLSKCCSLARTHCACIHAWHQAYRHGHELEMTMHELEVGKSNPPLQILRVDLGWRNMLKHCPYMKAIVNQGG